MGVEGASTRQSVLNLLRLIREYLTQMDIPTLSEAIRDKKAYFITKLDTACENAIKDSCTATNPVTPSREDIKNIFLNLLSK